MTPLLKKICIFVKKIFGKNWVFICKQNIMRKIIRLTENDLTRLVRRVIEEQSSIPQPKVGDSINIYKKGNPSINFQGTICSMDGRYLYIKNYVTNECIEFLWGEGISVKKIGSTIQVDDPSFNISGVFSPSIKKCKNCK